VPTSLPPAFAGIVRRCLNRDPASRASLADLEAWVNPAPQVSARAGAQPEVLPVGAAASPPGLVISPSEARVLTPRTATSSPKVAMPSPRRGPRNARPSATRRREPAKQRLLVPALALLITLALAVWAGLHLFQRHATPRQPAARPSAASQHPATPVPAPPDVPAPPAKADSGVARPASVPSPVLHQEIPDVPRSARDTIRGRINVVVRVTVDRSGKVVSAALENPGPSRYFARLALAAAKKWKFAPADQQSSRKWVLQFQFTRGRTTAHATPQRQS
jgi:TonB family protein